MKTTVLVVYWTVVLSGSAYITWDMLKDIYSAWWREHRSPSINELRDSSMPIGTCCGPGIGTRPGPWHVHTCPAWRQTDQL